MKGKEIVVCVIVFAVLFLCGCNSTALADRASNKEYWGQAHILLANYPGLEISGMPVKDNFPIEIWYSVPDGFEWKPGYYEKIFVKDESVEWQEIFEAGKQAPAISGALGHKGDIIRDIPMQNNAERDFKTVAERKGKLKPYFINLEANELSFKFVVFDSQGNIPAEATITASRHKKDLFVTMEFDSGLAKKIEENPANTGKTAQEVALEKISITGNGKKIENPKIEGNSITIPNVGIIPAGQTKEIIISSPINGFSGKGIRITIKLGQEDLDKDNKIKIQLEEKK